MKISHYRVILQRLWADDKQSTGVLYIVNEQGQPVFGSMCIERGARNNQKNVSNAPAGVYDLVFEWSPKFARKLWELKGVGNGRTELKIHPANYWHDLAGCIAPGIDLKDIDRDGYYDVTRSTDTVRRFNKVLSGITKTTIEIIDP